MKLSVLKNAYPGTITYYVGDKKEHVSHLVDCTLICNIGFSVDLPGVDLIHVENPQLYFYKLSHEVENEYLFEKNLWGNYKYLQGENCNVHPTAVIGNGVILGNGVSIGPNSVIYSKTEIGDSVRIDANCSIGTEGMMWAWEDGKKIFLKQLGGVKIGENCIIGSNSSIVRGSANEFTTIENDVNMAPGCLIGHGSFIGKYTHLANGVKTGGSSKIGRYNFIGSGSVISPGVKLESEDIVVGAGSTVTKDIKEEGVYVGTPSKKIKSSKGKLSGVPTWRK